MKIVDIVMENKKEKEYYNNVESIFRRLDLFKKTIYMEFGRLIVKLKEKTRFFPGIKAHIRIEYHDKTVDADVANLTEEEMASVKNVLKEIEALRKKTKVTLTIHEELE